MDRQSASRRRIAGVWVVGLLLALAAAAWAGIPPQEIRVETPVYRPLQPIPEIRERWNYSFSWSGVPVAKVSLTGGEVSGAQPRILDVYVRGETNSFLDLFWRYRLNAHGTIRLDPFAPGSYLALESIKRKLKTTRIAFDAEGNVKTSRTKKSIVHAYEFSCPNTYDILATVYLLLNLDYKQGESYRVDTLTGTARFLVTVNAEARETISVAGATHDAWRLEIATDKLTDPEESGNHTQTTLWVSAERPRRMLKAQSKLFVGSVYAELDSIEKLTEWPAIPPEVELGLSNKEQNGLSSEIRR